MVGDDVADFAHVFAAEGHTWVAHVGEGGDLFVELAFGETLGKHEHGGAHGGHEVNLVGETDAGVVAEDLDGLLEAASDVERVPFREVAADGIEVDDAILDHGAVDGDVWVEVDAGAPGILNLGHRVGAEEAQGGVVLGVLLHVDRVPVLGIGYTKDEVDDLTAAFLPFPDCFGRMRMRREGIWSCRLV